MSRFFFAMLCAFVAIDTAQAAADRTRELENSFAKDLLSAARAYRAAHENSRATNWNQILPHLSEDHLANLQKIFREETPTPGFTNSILEKYVFVPSGVMLESNPPGEILLMNAEPFSLSDGGLGRMVIFVKIGTNELGYRPAIDDAIQRAFQKAGKSIPRPIPMQPVKSTPRVKYDKEFEKSIRKDMREIANRIERGTNQDRGNTPDGVSQKQNLGTNLTTPLATTEPVSESRARIALVTTILSGLALGFWFWRRGRSAQ